MLRVNCTSSCCPDFDKKKAVPSDIPRVVQGRFSHQKEIPFTTVEVASSLPTVDSTSCTPIAFEVTVHRTSEEMTSYTSIVGPSDQQCGVAARIEPVDR